MDLKKIKDCEVRIVLGHHPIDWFIENEASSLRALLAKQNVLYLHGHLHEDTFRQEMGREEEFLTIMAGASYQAREHKLWVNSFYGVSLITTTNNFVWNPGNGQETIKVD